jgi:hypothetical protein
VACDYAQAVVEPPECFWGWVNLVSRTCLERLSLRDPWNPSQTGVRSAHASVLQWQNSSQRSSSPAGSPASTKRRGTVIVDSMCGSERDGRPLPDKGQIAKVAMRRSSHVSALGGCPFLETVGWLACYALSCLRNTICNCCHFQSLLSAPFSSLGQAISSEGQRASGPDGDLGMSSLTLEALEADLNTVRSCARPNPTRLVEMPTRPASQCLSMRRTRIAALHTMGRSSYSVEY